MGTGFLVGRKEVNDSTKSTVYIVTNKHVVRGQRELYVRFNHTGAAGVKDLLMSLADPNGSITYSEHPNANVDVVAIQIVPNVIISNNLNLSFFDLVDHALTLEQMQNTGVDEGSLV